MVLGSSTGGMTYTLSEVELIREKYRQVPDKPPEEKVIKVQSLGEEWSWQLEQKDIPIAKSAGTFSTVSEAAESALEVFPETITEVSHVED